MLQSTPSWWRIDRGTGAEMLGEAAIRLSAAGDVVAGEGGESVRGSTSFLASALLRALMEQESLDRVGATDRPDPILGLLKILSRDLFAPAVVLLSPESLEWRASIGLPALARGVLAEAGESSDEMPLARRVIEERRIVLLGPGSRDLRLARLREVRSDLQVLALVPLFDQHQPTGVLVLAAPDGRLLSEEILPCLSSVFALLGLLVGGRRIGLAVADVPDRSDSEHLEVRLEESHARNVEAEDSLRRAQEAASSSDAAGRADLAAARARIAELEARVATLQGEAQTRSDDAGNYTALASEASIGAMRIKELEEEIVRLDEALRGGTLVTTDLAQSDAVSEVTAPLAIEEDGAEEVELGAIAEAAAAALETLPGTHASDADTRQVVAVTDEGLPEFDVLDTPTSAADESDAAAEVVPTEESLIELLEEEEIDEEIQALALWYADGGSDIDSAISEIAEAAGAAFWTGAGEAPLAARTVVAANLFAEGLDEVFAAVHGVAGGVRGVAYAAEEGVGFELGAVGWLPRPLDPVAVLESVSGVSASVRSVLLVSADLRAIAPLRESLSAAEVAGSVACDVRQALDLLEIVQRPDAILIDLALEGGQGLALAAQLRGENATADVPLFLFLPATLDSVRLRADAKAARLLGPYGASEIRSLIGTALRTNA